jgi:Alginate export
MDHKSTETIVNSKVVTSALIAATTLGSFSTISIGQDDQSTEITYPKYKLFRYDEDWSEFDPTNGSDFFDDIKHVKLNKDGSVWASFGGEFRIRSETWDSFGFSSADTSDDTFLLGRSQRHMDLHIGDRFRVFVEGESALATDRDLPGGRRTLDIDTFDLQNAFADIIIPFGDDDDQVTLRVGRQGLSYGRQRLVSTLPWSNSQRSWDGVKAIFEVNGWKIDSFYTRFTPVKKYDFNDWMAGPDFWGVYASTKLGEEKSIGLDVYYLGLETDDPKTINGTSGVEERHTIGARIWGKFGESNFGYDAEGAYQFGDLGSADINAYMIATEFYYQFDSEWQPKVYVGFDYSSGDDSAGDGDVETFNQLFPLGHAFNGYMDLIGRQNIIDVSAGVSFKPHKKVLVKADFHSFTRSSDDDSVYNAGGGVLRATTAGASDTVGQEIDFTVKYFVNRNLTLSSGYSHFFTGDYFSDTGSDEDVDFFYFQAQYKF